MRCGSGTRDPPKADLNVQPKASPFASFGGFGAPAQSSASNGGFSFGANTLAATTTKGSSLNGSASFGAFNPSTPAAAPASPAKDSSSSPVFQYFKSLRALNVGLIDSLEQAVEKDPFADLTSVLLDIQKRYSEKRAEHVAAYEATKSQPKALSPAPPAPVEKPAFAAPAPSAAPTGGMPAPPAAFSFAGQQVASAPSASPSAPAGTGFTPTAVTGSGSSIFSFPAAASTPASGDSSKAATGSGSPMPVATSDQPSAAGKLVSSKPKVPTSMPFTGKLPNAPNAPSPLRFGRSASPPPVPESTEKKDEPASKKRFSFGESFGSVAKGSSTPAETSSTQAAPEEPKAPAPLFGTPSTSAAAEAPKPAFSFGATPAPPTDANANADADASKGEAPKPAFSGFGSMPFGAARDSSAPAPADAPKPAFSFGAAVGSGDAAKTTTDSDAAPKPAFSFGTPASSAPDAAKAFSFGAGAAPSAGTAKAFSFGAPAAASTSTDETAKPSTPTRNPFSGPSGSSPPSFTFGAGLKKSESSFGKPSTSPVGFSFGGSSPGASSGSAPAATGFSFAAQPNPFAPAAPAETAAPADEAAAPPAAAAAEEGEGGNPFSKPGEGEENENTLHEVRCSVIKLEDGQWHKSGTGTIAVKEDRETGKHRLLARNEVNSNVMVNFRITPQLEVSVEKTFLIFVGFDGSKPQPYRVRTKTKEQAEELKRAIDKTQGKT